MYRHKQESLAPAGQQLRSVGLFSALALLSLWWPAPALAQNEQVKLTRRFTSGRRMVYATKMHTKALVHSEPPELQDFLPPLPTDLSVRQQITVTVKAVHDDGSADIENRFDKFDFKSDLADRVPDNFRDPTVNAQQEISKRVVGQDIVAHFDRRGKLLEFEGGEGLFEELDPSYQEPLRQALRFFLEQVGGVSLYPEQPVKPGGTWKNKLDSPASAAYPYDVEGENTLRYIGKTKVGGIDAAVVEFNYVEALKPARAAMGKTDPLAQLESHGLGVNMRINGQGNGRVLLALDDGRVLQNHALTHQTLIATLNKSDSLPFTKAQTLKLEVKSDTEMDVEGAGE